MGEEMGNQTHKTFIDIFNRREAGFHRPPITKHLIPRWPP